MTMPTTSPARPRPFRLILTVLGLLLLLGLAACQGQADEPAPEPAATNLPAETDAQTAEPTEAAAPTAEVPPTNTPEPAPTATEEMEPTATPEPAEPTPTSTPEPTATPAVQSFDEEGVAFELSPDLNVTDVTIQRIPAQRIGEDGPAEFFADVPEFIQVILDRPEDRGTILIQPIRDEAGNFYSSLPADLRQYYVDFEQQLADESEGRIDQQQLAYQPFGSGSGLRAISYAFVTPGVAKISNENVYYFYDGFTSDRRYYVAVQFPIDAEGLDDGGALTQEEFDAAAADFDTYIVNTLSPLDSLPPAAFEPNLEAIDALLASLTIEEEASTAVSPLVECTYDAAFVEDVTIPDASLINPGTPFQKIWRVANTGTCAWDSSFTATFIDGDNLNWTGFVQVDNVEPGETFDIAVDLQAPEEAGIYEGRWQMVDPLLRPFGIRVFVTIVVPEEPLEPTPEPTAESSDDGGDDDGG